MKKSKILFLFPLAALLLGGCSLQEVWGKVTETFQNIIKVEDANGKKEEKETKDENNNQENNNQNQNQGEGENNQGQGEGGNQQGQGEGEGGGGQQGGGGSVEAGTYTFNFDTQEFTNTSGSKSGISFESAKADGQNDPAYNSTSNELRLYVGNTLTISADAEITSVTFNANTCVAVHEKATGGLTSTPGSVSKVTDGFKWTGSAKSIKFTCDPGKQVHINYFTVVIGEGGEGGQGQGEGGGGQTHQDSELLITLKGIITPIACQILNCEASELVWLDYDSNDDADIYYLDTENLTFVELCAYSEELAFDEAQALLASFLPEGSELDDEASFDMSEYGYAELWYKTGDYYYILTTQSGENEAGDDAVMCYFDIVLQSQGDAYADYFDA